MEVFFNFQSYLRCGRLVSQLMTYSEAKAHCSGKNSAVFVKAKICWGFEPRSQSIFGNQVTLSRKAKEAKKIV